MHYADRAVVMRMLHEIAADHSVPVCHALRLLRSRRQQNADVLDPSKRKHISTRLHIERVSLERAAGKRLDAVAPLIQTNILHVPECEHANVFGLSQYTGIDAAETRRRAELVVALV